MKYVCPSSHILTFLAKNMGNYKGPVYTGAVGDEVFIPFTHFKSVTEMLLANKLDVLPVPLSSLSDAYSKGDNELRRMFYYCLAYCAARSLNASGCTGRPSLRVYHLDDDSVSTEHRSIAESDVVGLISSLGVDLQKRFQNVVSCITAEFSINTAITSHVYNTQLYTFMCAYCAYSMPGMGTKIQFEGV